MKQKKEKMDYNILIYFNILLISGLVLGLYLSKYININDTNGLNSYLSVMMDGLNPNNYFVSQFMIGTITILLVTLLGTSICGFPLISFFIFSKGMQIGFSCILFLLTYSYKGILGIIIVFIPEILIDIIALYIASQASLYLSLSMIHSVTTTTIMPLKNKINIMLNVILVSILLIFVSSYFKSTIGIELIKIFKNL